MTHKLAKTLLVFTLFLGLAFSGSGTGAAWAAETMDPEDEDCFFECRPLPQLEEINEATRRLAWALVEEKPDLELIKKLLAEGADPNAQFSHGLNGFNTALYRNAGPEVIRLLLAAGARTEAFRIAICPELPLTLATRKYRLTIRETDRTGPPRMADLFDDGPYNPDPAMFIALLEAGAGPQARDGYGRTAGFAAAQNPNLEFMRAWLRAGGQTGRTDGGDDTILMAAAKFNLNPEMIGLLVGAGEDIKAVDINRATALHIAAAKNPNPEVVEALLKAGADPNAADSSGKTPLMWAAHYSPQVRAVMRLLVEKGARAELRSGDGHDILYWARWNPNPEEALDTARELLRAADNNGLD